ncbi:DUF932 domain-containing protein [Thermomonospora umbrina]|uniref:DUF932 domain-containing protein n=1 Tax=Thermomonospora umbrina TaxID=111806 RepID=A0A3D9T155_9ACTN|nr:DUF932 domain-containing protein [Thermomonospora umbrina]REF00551.1 hypothetical protein DFJ69_6100 [Thermomonospora umbrina]
MYASVATRNADLTDLKNVLLDQQSRKLDVVVSARHLHAEGGNLAIDDTDPVLSEDGVTSTTGLFRPTHLFDEGVSDKLGIPRAYLTRMRQEAIGLYDTNVNGWLRKMEATPDKKFLVRVLRGHTGGSADGTGGVARALLSDGYRIIDNLDVLLAVLDGIRRTGLNVTIDGCDLTERRMYVRVVAPQIHALAPALLKRYRSPFTGAMGADNPVMFAGFVVTNSETGCGAFTLTPRIVAQVCGNGYTISRDAERNVHLGGRLDEGVVAWSDQTRQSYLDLITNKSKDAVQKFLDPVYLSAKIDQLQKNAHTPVTDPLETIKFVGVQLGFSQERRDEILDHFIKGADATAGGIMHAVTSVARGQDDADIAHDLEVKAPRALELAARR